MQNVSIENKCQPDLTSLFEGVVKGGIVIKTKIAAEPDKCFLHSPDIRAYLPLLLAREVKIESIHGYDIFYSLEGSAILY